jgi:hypothetical protein
MSQGNTGGRIVAMLPVLPVLLAIAGCQSPSHDTGELYGVSEKFDGHVGEHMPVVFAKYRGEPGIVLTLCRKTTEASRVEMASYNLHVTILSAKKQYDLEDNRIEFIADGERISLARAGAVGAGPGEHAANYPIGMADIETLAKADHATVRIMTAGAHMTRDLDQTQLAAVDEFYVVCVEPGADRHAGVND